ncbi:isoprenoid synthase domain-containing protein [Sporodiniella umbellata]|nr:isoprenoid synthase domain-containing protein [Sporodiniella umbellata]
MQRLARLISTRNPTRLASHAYQTTPFSKITQGLGAVTSSLLGAPSFTQPKLETLPFSNQAETWVDAVKEAQGLIHTENSERIFDPSKLMVGQDLWELKGNITKLLGSGHPFLDTMRRHYLESDTYRIRPLLVLLMAQALGPVTEKQHRLSEIAEMIHTATCLHNDIIESPSLGNKMAVLAGDFLLARASLALAQLHNAECTELIATCITSSVEGMFMQLESEQVNSNRWDYYQKQAYMNTVSLIAQSVKASTVLAQSSNDISRAAYTFGRHLGIAFHYRTDILQFPKLESKTYKSTPNDWISAPVLLAWKEHDELEAIIQRQFSQSKDKDKALYFVHESQGLKKTFDLIDHHIEKAIESIEPLPASNAKAALVQLARLVPTKQD